MKRLFWIPLWCIILLAALPPFDNLVAASRAASEITATIDNRPVYFDVAPQKINGRIMVPLRAIFEGLGAEVSWEGATETITGKKEGVVVTLRLNDTKAEVNGKIVMLDVAATKVSGRTFVPARFVAESFGADVQWDESKQEIIITTGAAATLEGTYYFVYNSEKTTSQDIASIKRFANKFRSTRNVLFDAVNYKTAAELYDALKTAHRKQGGVVAGVQIFGVVEDVPAFSYVHKMKVMESSDRWNGVEHNRNETFVTDFFYSTFKNDSKLLNQEITVYGIIQDKLPITIIPEWPVSRLPLTKGEISNYVSRYEAYRQQIEGASVPTVVLSAPTQFQDGYAQNDVGLFIKRLQEDAEFGLFTNSSPRIYYKDLAAHLTKEIQSGPIDLVIGSAGDNEGATQSKLPFFDRQSAADLNANDYTPFFWGMAAAKGMNVNSIIHDGLTKGSMINPISVVTFGSNGTVENYAWTQVPAPEGEQDGDWNDYVAVNKELLKQKTNPYFFIYKYYQANQNGKSRLESFHVAKIAYAQLSVNNQATLGAAHGYEYVISLHYLGLADYK